MPFVLLLFLIITTDAKLNASVVNAEIGYSTSVRVRDSCHDTFQLFYQTEIVEYNSQFEQTHTFLHSSLYGFGRKVTKKFSNQKVKETFLYN